MLAVNLSKSQRKEMAVVFALYVECLFKFDTNLPGLTLLESVKDSDTTQRAASLIARGSLVPQGHGCCISCAKVFTSKESLRAYYSILKDCNSCEPLARTYVKLPFITLQISEHYGTELDLQFLYSQKQHDIASSRRIPQDKQNMTLNKTDLDNLLRALEPYKIIKLQNNKLESFKILDDVRNVKRVCQLALYYKKAQETEQYIVSALFDHIKDSKRCILAKPQISDVASHDLVYTEVGKFPDTSLRLSEIKRVLCAFEIMYFETKKFMCCAKMAHFGTGST